MTGSKLSFCFVESSFTSSCTLQQTPPELLSPQTATEELPAGASPLLNGHPGVINRNGYVQRHLILPTPRIFGVERHTKFSKNEPQAWFSPEVPPWYHDPILCKKSKVAQGD